jgi:thioredoxin-like negative regulator of GroEL
MFRLALLVLFVTPALADAPPATTTASVQPAQPTYEQLMSQALALEVQGQKDQAIAQLMSAAKADPKAAKPHEKLCTLLYGAGQLDRALASCKGWMARETNRMRQGQIKAMVGILE